MGADSRFPSAAVGLQFWGREPKHRASTSVSFAWFKKSMVLVEASMMVIVGGG
jgi:hypothetical protein